MEAAVQAVQVDLARQGLKVMLVAHPDACRTCRNMQGRIFDPLGAPPLPLLPASGCSHYTRAGNRGQDPCWTN